VKLTPNEQFVLRALPADGSKIGKWELDERARFREQMALLRVLGALRAKGLVEVEDRAYREFWFWLTEAGKTEQARLRRSK
jgi:hypothetical protein